MDIDLGRLPHWSRVAFAARCARLVQPLFMEAWPEVALHHKETVERAIVLAEQSARERRPQEALRDAIMAAQGTAGRAQIPHLFPVTLEDGESPPADGEQAVIASLAAKVAQFAAESAAADPSRSIEPSRSAYYFARDTLHAAGRLGLMERIEADYATLPEATPRKPWWRFW